MKLGLGEEVGGYASFFHLRRERAREEEPRVLRKPKFGRLFVGGFFQRSSRKILGACEERVYI